MGSGLAIEMAKKIMAIIQQALYLAAADDKLLQTLGSRVVSVPRAVHEWSKTGARKQCSMHDNQVLITYTGSTIFHPGNL